MKKYFLSLTLCIVVGCSSPSDEIVKSSFGGGDDSLPPYIKNSIDTIFYRDTIYIHDTIYKNLHIDNVKELNIN